MTQEEMALKIEELMNVAKMASSLQHTLFTAFYCQNEFSIRDFEWAFVLLGDLAGHMRDELMELTGSAFDSIKRKKNDV